MLGRAPALRRLNRRQLASLLEVGKCRDLEAGEVLFREGEAAEGPCVVVRGFVRVSKELERGGPSAPIAIRGPGDWIGELSLEAGEVRSATAVAESRVRLLALPRTPFLAVVGRTPEAVLELLFAVSRRLRESDSALVEALRKRAEDLRETNLRLGIEVHRLRQEGPRSLAAFAGCSQAAARVRASAARAGKTSLPVLLTGEAGTGKRLLAELVHRTRARQAGRFAPLETSLLTGADVEADLFGCARGGRPAARRAEVGLVEQARGGTLYLEHLDRLSLGVQAQILRLLEAGEYQRVGESRIRRGEVRVIASIEADPRQAVRSGTLRPELLERLSSLRIDVPPLRHRRADIPAILLALSEEVANTRGAPLLRFGRPSLRVLSSAELPANGDDLRTEVERLYLELPPGAGVELADLHAEVIRGETVRYGDALRAFKLALVGEALREAGGSPARAAERLGLHPSNLHRMLRELGLATGGRSK